MKAVAKTMLSSKVHMNEKGIRFLSCPLDRHEKLLGIFA